MCSSCGTSGSLSLFSLIFSLLGFLIWLLVLGWVYNDADEKGHSGCIWLFLVFIFGFLGLAIYLIFFHGVPATRRHKATNRNEDFLYRSMYRAQTPASPGARRMPNQWGQPVSRTSTPTGDPDFRDEELDRLIRNGKLSEARAYLRDMQSIAREMNDTKGLANYRQYEAKLAQAAGKSSRERSPGRY